MPRASSSLTETGLGVSRGRLGGAARGPDVGGGQRLSDDQLGQHHLLVRRLRLGVVRPFDVRPQEAGERDHLARGGEDGRSVAAGVSRRPDRRSQAGRIPHLGGEGPLPDQLVESELIADRGFAARLSGVRKLSPAGRIASWASWARFGLRLEDPGRVGQDTRYRTTSTPETWRRESPRPDRVNESVRM